MNFEEHVAKARVLAPAGVPVPRSRVCGSAGEAAQAFGEIGPCVVKAQVPTGKRGKAGGIRTAESPEEAGAVAAAILDLSIDGHAVASVLVEERVPIARELYAAVLHDWESRRPLVLFSTEGGMDIEEVAAERPDAIRRRTGGPMPPAERFDVDRAERRCRAAIGDEAFAAAYAAGASTSVDDAVADALGVHAPAD